jgi:hypothetical protein
MFKVNYWMHRFLIFAGQKWAGKNFGVWNTGSMDLVAEWP